MPVLPSYRSQSIDLLCKLTGFYMMATLAFNGLNKNEKADRAVATDKWLTLDLYVLLENSGSFFYRTPLGNCC